MGVLGVMFAIKIMQRIFKINFKEEARLLSKKYPFQQELTNTSVKITQQAIINMPLRDIIKKYELKIVFGRMQQHNREVILPNYDTQLQLDDAISVIGDLSEVERVIELFGEEMDELLTYDRTFYDVKRMFVSNPAVAGQTLASLNLPSKFSAIVTRIQRGDMDLLATGDTVLELGDRVRMVAQRSDVKALSQTFGDSYERLSHINLLSFGAGMALGLLLGMITFQLTEDIGFRLGFAGGPLIAGLVLGSLRRTGPIVWTLPFSANLTIRQFGLILLLAGIGINSGHTFLTVLQGGGGGAIFLASAFISILSAVVTLLVGYKLLKIPFTVLMGMVANQPAILDFALEQSNNKMPNIGFTIMLPIALITKILFVQLLFTILYQL